MSARVTGLVVLLSILGLTACGGGSSSSGATQGGPAPTAFAGTYNGQFSVNAQGFTESTRVIIAVSDMGRVALDFPDTQPAACVTEPSPTTPFLAGDRIGIVVRGSCFSPELGGTCEVELEGEIVFSRTDAVGNGPFRLRCPNGNFDITWGIGATKIS